MGGRVAVAMSGGVDSSVTADLIQKAGYETWGITLWLQDENCGSKQDAEDASKVAAGLGIPHITLDYRQEFSEKVIKYFVDSYLNGETPNPCVECNKHIKFGRLCRDARDRGFDYIATGHYARIEGDKASGRSLLRKARCPEKDQSYVLFGLTKEQLAMTLLPLGELSKEEVRSIAEEGQMVNAHKKDSQDICFVPDGDYAGFIEKYEGQSFSPGEFVSTKGEVLGTHKGLIHYTIGQRKGLGLSMCTPVYVKYKDVINNRVVIAQDRELFGRNLYAHDLNFTALDRIEGTMRLKAKIRYRHQEQWAQVTQLGEDEIHVEFEEPQRAISPGQYVVLYDGDYVVGGGTISAKGLS